MSDTDPTELPTVPDGWGIRREVLVGDHGSRLPVFSLTKTRCDGLLCTGVVDADLFDKNPEVLQHHIAAMEDVIRQTPVRTDGGGHE